MTKFDVNGRKDLPLSPIGQQRRDWPARLLYQLYFQLNTLLGKIESSLVQRVLNQVGMGHIYEIPTYTNNHELNSLYKLAAALPRGARVLEIGSHLGASSCYLAAGLAQVGGQLLCVDTWQNDAMPDGRKDTMAIFQKNIYPLRHLITPLRKNSQDLTAADLQSHFDLIFIDGDHSYEAVRQDFELLQSWLAPGGLIAFHDFAHEHHEGVTRLLGEALASGDWILVGLVDTLAWIKRAHWQHPPLPEQTEDSAIYNYPTVTVLLSVYNGERYLRESIESILNQTFTDFEFLIINDGSTDDSRRIISSYDDPRIQLIDNEQNIGLSQSLNKGLKLARGTYIARQDADDISEPERLAKQVSYMDRNPHIALLGSWYRMIDGAGNPFGHWGDSVRLSSEHIDLQWELMFFNPFIHSVVMMRKSQLLNCVGFYNEEYCYAMDWELWRRIADRWLVSNFPEYLVRYRINPHSMTATYGEKTNEGVELCVKTISSLLNWDQSNYLSNETRYRKMYKLLYRGVVCLDIKDVIQMTMVVWQLHQEFCAVYQLNQLQIRRHRAKLQALLSKRYIHIALSYTTNGQYNDALKLYKEALCLNPLRFLTIKSARLLYKLVLLRFLERIGLYKSNG